MTRGGLPRCFPRAAGAGVGVALMAAAVGLVGCSAGPETPSLEAVARDEVAAVIARRFPAASEPSRACLVDRLAADGVEPDRLERYLADGELTAGDERRGSGVALELSVATARAVCLTVDELLAES